MPDKLSGVRCTTGSLLYEVLHVVEPARYSRIKNFGKSSSGDQLLYENYRDVL